MENNIVVTFIILAGLFSILASLFNWDFFFENRRTAFFMHLFGRKGARVFYFILGLLLFFLAYKVLTE